MSRQGENLKTLERLSDGIPIGEMHRFHVYVIWELAKVVGVRRFFVAVKAAKRRHSG